MIPWLWILSYAIGLTLVAVGVVLKFVAVALLGFLFILMPRIALLAPARHKQKVLVGLKSMRKRSRMELDQRARFVNEILDMLALSSGVKREDVETFLNVLRRADSFTSVRFRARGVEIDLERRYWDGALLLTIKRRGPAGEESVSVDITNPWYLDWLRKEAAKRATEKR